MNVKLYFLILIISPGLLHAQDYTITGQILDINGPVAYAHVSLDSSEISTVTDNKGFFKIHNLPKGRYLVQVFAVGFQYSKTEIVLDNKSLTSLTINLTPLSEELQLVILENGQTGLQKNTPFNLSIINLQGLLKQSHPNGIMGMLRQVPGVNGAEMGQGIVKPIIRGLGFSRVVSIYQGNKLENHQWGADHGLGVNDLGVKAVEVIKGPASVLYGSGALGGVLVTRDEDIFQKNNNLSGTLSSSVNSSSHGLRTTASLGEKLNDHWFIGTDLGYEQHADYRSGNGRPIGNSRFRATTLRLHTGYEKQGSKQKLSFTYNAQKLGIISDKEMNQAHSLSTNNWDYKMQLPHQEIKDFLLSYNQTTNGKNLNTYFHLSHHLNDRQEIESGMNKVDLGLQQQHSFLNGRVDFKKENLLHQLGMQSSLISSDNKSAALDILIPDSKIFESGFFYMGTLKTDQYFLQAALRFDYRKVTAYANKKKFIEYGFILPGEPKDRQLSKHFSGFTASLGITRQMGLRHTMKANFSTGFRAPDLAELFSNGRHPGTNRFEIGDIGFQREQTYQMDWRYEYRSKHFKAAVSAFAMRIEDYIFFKPSGEVHPENHLQVWSYSQQDVKFHGIEVEATLKIGERLSSKLSGSLVRAQEKESAESLSMIPADNLSLEMTYRALRDNSLHVSSQLQLFASQNRIAFNEKPTTGYDLINLTASKTFSLPSYQFIEVAITAENILDKRYVNHLSMLRPFDIPNPGRNIRAGLKYSF